MGGRGRRCRLHTEDNSFTVESLTSYGSWWAPDKVLETKRLVNLESLGVKAADMIQEPGIAG